jgi:membrane-associated phospholipid phosphatase
MGLVVFLLVSTMRPAAAADRQWAGEVWEESLLTGARIAIEDVTALVAAPLQMDRDHAVMFGGGVALLGGLIAVDKPMNRLIQRHTTVGGDDAFAKVNTWLGPSALAGINAGAIVMGLGMEEWGRANTLSRTGLIGLEAEGLAVVTATALKVVLGRTRPAAQQGATHLQPFAGLGGSFPSGHAAASFAVATVFAERYPGPVAWTAYTLAAAVSFGRLYANQHWTSDVAAGALIGWGIGRFLSQRHRENPNDWRIRPVAMGRGMGAGIGIELVF